MLIPMPAAPIAANIEWTLDQPGQVNRSEFTGRRKVTILAAAPRWSAKVTMPPILGEAAALTWRAFAVDLDGVANSFRLVIVEGPQLPGITPHVVGGGQFGHSLATGGWGAAGPKLKRGQFVTINDQPLMLTADIIADGAGNATISFKAYIRVSPVDGLQIEANEPYALVSMTDSKAGWTVGIGQKYAFTFDVEESF